MTPAGPRFAGSPTQVRVTGAAAHLKYSNHGCRHTQALRSMDAPQQPERPACANLGAVHGAPIQPRQRRALAYRVCSRLEARGARGARTDGAQRAAGSKQEVWRPRALPGDASHSVGQAVCNCQVLCAQVHAVHARCALVRVCGLGRHGQSSPAPPRRCVQTRVCLA